MGQYYVQGSQPDAQNHSQITTENLIIEKQYSFFKIFYAC